MPCSADEAQREKPERKDNMKRLSWIIVTVLLIFAFMACASAKEFVVFGSYPQSEVQESALLKNAVYNEIGDAEIDGKKYRRVLSEDGYRYFIYEPILWENHGDVYISKYVLDCRMYDAQEKKYTYGLGRQIEYASSTSWETCSIRSWLHGEFYQTAFSASEKDNIIGNTVALFSPDSAKQVEGEFALQKTCTDYARAMGVKEKKGYCAWLLRDVSPVAASTVCTITEEGKVNNGITVLVNNEQMGVVPCIQMKNADNRVQNQEAEKCTVYAPYGRAVVIAVSDLEAYISVGWYKTAEEAKAQLYHLINARFENSSLYETYKPYVFFKASQKNPEIQLDYPQKNPTVMEIMQFIEPLKQAFFTGKQEDYMAIDVKVTFDMEEGKSASEVYNQKLGNAIEMIYPAWGPMLSGSNGGNLIHYNAGNTFSATIRLKMNGSGSASVRESDYFDKVYAIARDAVSYSDRALGQLQYVRNYLAENAVYDGAQFHNNPQSLLLDGVGVCGNYAIAVKDICTVLGIPCFELINEKGSHAWNCVYVEGAWYEFDTTGITQSDFFTDETVYSHEKSGFPSAVYAENVSFLYDVTYGTKDGDCVDTQVLAYMQEMAKNAKPLIEAPVQEDKKEDIKVLVFGKELATDVPAFILNGRTLVPMRAVFEALGATVYWNEDTRTVTAVSGVDVISLEINNPMMTKNGKNITLDVPATIREGRTMVPVRAVSESFGLQVLWDEKGRVVSVVE